MPPRHIIKSLLKCSGETKATKNKKKQSKSKALKILSIYSTNPHSQKTNYATASQIMKVPTLFIGLPDSYTRIEQERNRGEGKKKTKQKKGGVMRDIILKVPEWLLKLTTVK